MGLGTFPVFAWMALVVLAGSVGSPFAHADEGQATLQKNSGALISGLAIEGDKFLIDTDTRGTNPVLHVTLKGVYSQPHPGWSLSTLDKELVSTKAGGKDSKRDYPFSADIRLTGPETHVDLVAVSPNGDLQKQTLTLAVDQWDSLMESARASAAARSHFEVGAGATLLSLKDSRLPNTSEFGLDFRADWSKVFAQTPFGVRADLSITAVPAASSTSFDYRLMTVDAQAGCRLPIEMPAWAFSIGLGYFYETTFTSASYGGFENLSGPLIRAEADREIGTGTGALSAAFAVIGPNSFSYDIITVDAEYRMQDFTMGLEFTSLADTIDMVTFSQQTYGLIWKTGF